MVIYEEANVNMNKAKILIFIPTLAVILIFIARSSSVLDLYFPNGFLGLQLSLIKDICMVVGILIQVLLISLPLYNAKNKIKTYETQLESLLGFQREAFNASIANTIGLKSINLNIRIFLPKMSKLHFIYKYFPKLIRKPEKKEFIIKNVTGLAVTGITKDLTFEVNPKAEGVIGKCFQCSEIAWDDALRSQDTKDKYHMTPAQANKTSDLSFCLCVPLFDKKGKILSVVAFDTNDSKFKLPPLKSNEMDTLMQLFTHNSQFLYEYFPEAFNNVKEGF